MSATATQSGGYNSRGQSRNYAPDGMDFVDCSNFKKNRWKYVGETQPEPESDITDVDTQNATIIRHGDIIDLDKRKSSNCCRNIILDSGTENGLIKATQPIY